MIVGKVVGTVVSTIQHPWLDGRRLLLVERLGADGKPSGGTVIAVDTIDAGAGETVIVMDEGNSARQIVGSKDAPVRTVIVGVIDHLDVPGSAHSSAAAAAGAEVRSSNAAPGGKNPPAGKRKPRS